MEGGPPVPAGMGIAIEGEPGGRLRGSSRRLEAGPVASDQLGGGARGAVGVDDAEVALLIDPVSTGPPPGSRRPGACVQHRAVEQLMIGRLAGKSARVGPHVRAIPYAAAKLGPVDRLAPGGEVDVAGQKAGRVGTVLALGNGIALGTDEVNVLGRRRQGKVVGQGIPLPEADQMVGVEGMQSTHRVVPLAAHQVVHEPPVGSHHDTPGTILGKLPVAGSDDRSPSRGTAMLQSASALARSP